MNVFSLNSVNFGYENWEEFSNIIDNNKRYFFIIANPAHKITSLAPPNEITGWTYFNSFASRIFIGYAYFQFISAFRRLGKK